MRVATAKDVGDWIVFECILRLATRVGDLSALVTEGTDFWLGGTLP